MLVRRLLPEGDTRHCAFLNLPLRARAQHLIDLAKQHLIANHTRLQQLSQRSGLLPAAAEPDDSSATLRGFQQALAEWERQLHGQSGEKPALAVWFVR
jgi:hypothetical protein